MQRLIAVLGCVWGLWIGMPAASAQTVLAASAFDAGAEGWVVKDMPPPPPNVPVPLDTYAPIWEASGGNPGGHIRFADPTTNSWYWKAPSAFLGNKATAFGGTLAFDLKVSGSAVHYDQEDLILVGAGLTLVRDFAAPAKDVFVRYDISLNETGWFVGDLSGAPATAGQLQTVLGSLDEMLIRGEQLRALDDQGYLDNVALLTASETPPVPEPSGALLFLSASGAIVLLRKRRHA